MWQPITVAFNASKAKVVNASKAEVVNTAKAKEHALSAPKTQEWTLLRSRGGNTLDVFGKQLPHKFRVKPWQRRRNRSTEWALRYRRVAKWLWYKTHM